MTELICGFLGFILSLGVFMLGFFIGRKTIYPRSQGLVCPGEPEIEHVLKERERMKQDQEAFRALTGYSADVAYGLTKFPLEEATE